MWIPAGIKETKGWEGDGGLSDGTPMRSGGFWFRYTGWEFNRTGASTASGYFIERGERGEAAVVDTQLVTTIRGILRHMAKRPRTIEIKFREHELGKANIMSREDIIGLTARNSCSL